MNNRIKDIYMQYYSMVIGIAYNTLHNMDASSDVAAEVFLKLVENMKVKNDIKNVKAWLFYKKNKKWFDICLMHFLLGMSIKEISEYYKCTESVIEGNLYRARKYIQKNYSSLKSFT